MSEINTKVMDKLTHGLYVCTVRDGERVNGCIINTAFQVELDSNLISIALNKSSLTYEILEKTRECNISVLSEDMDRDIIYHFENQSGRDVNKFASDSPIKSELAENGIPYITEGTSAYFSLKVKYTLDLESHMIFVCEPTFMAILSEAKSCSYDHYRSHINPTKEQLEAMFDSVIVWRCPVCRYEFLGDGLPRDFICPCCGTDGDFFEKTSW